MLLHFTTKNNLHFWKCPLNLWIHRAYIYIQPYIYIYLLWISEYVDTYTLTHTHKPTHMLHPSHLIAHIIHLVPVFWQGIGTSVVESDPLRLPGISQQTKSSSFLPHSGLPGLLNTLHFASFFSHLLKSWFPSSIQDTQQNGTCQLCLW